MQGSAVANATIEIQVEQAKMANASVELQTEHNRMAREGVQLVEQRRDAELQIHNAEHNINEIELESCQDYWRTHMIITVQHLYGFMC